MKNVKKLLLACMMLSAGHCPAINIGAAPFSNYIVQNWKPFSQRPNGIAPKAQPWRPGWKTKTAAAIGLTAAGAAALYYWWQSQQLPECPADLDRVSILHDFLTTTKGIVHMERRKDCRIDNIADYFQKYPELLENLLYQMFIKGEPNLEERESFHLLGNDAQATALAAAEYARQQANDAGNRAFAADVARNATMAAIQATKQVALQTDLHAQFTADAATEAANRLAENITDTFACQDFDRQQVEAAGNRAFAADVALNATMAAEHAGSHAFPTANGILQGAASRLVSAYQKRCVSALSSVKDLGIPLLTPLAWGYAAHQAVGEDLVGKVGEENQTTDAPATLSPALASALVAGAAGFAAQTAAGVYADNTGMHDGLDLLTKSSLVHGGLLASYLGYKYFTKPSRKDLPSGDYIITHNDGRQEFFKRNGEPFDGTVSQFEKRQKKRTTKLAARATPAHGATGEKNPLPSPGLGGLVVVESPGALVPTTSLGSAAPTTAAPGANGTPNPKASASAPLAADSTLATNEQTDGHMPAASPHTGEGSMSPKYSAANTPFPSPGLGGLAVVESPGALVPRTSLGSAAPAAPLAAPTTAARRGGETDTPPSASASGDATLTANPAGQSAANTHWHSPEGVEFDGSAELVAGRAEPTTPASETNNSTRALMAEAAASSPTRTPKRNHCRKDNHNRGGKSARREQDIGALSVFNTAASTQNHGDDTLPDVFLFEGSPWDSSAAANAASTPPTTAVNRPVAPENRQTLPSGDYTITDDDGSVKYFTNDNTELSLSQWTKRQKRLKRGKKDASASAGVAAPATPARRGGTDTPARATASGDATLAAGQSAANTPWHSPEGIEFDRNAELVAGGAANGAAGAGTGGGAGAVAGAESDTDSSYKKYTDYTGSDLSDFSAEMVGAVHDLKDNMREYSTTLPLNKRTSYYRAKRRARRAREKKAAEPTAPTTVLPRSPHD